MTDWQKAVVGGTVLLLVAVGIYDLTGPSDYVRLLVLWAMILAVGIGLWLLGLPDKS